MKLYQEKQGIVNNSIEITNLELLYEKASNGFLQLAMSLGIEAVLMLFEDDVERYAGPKGKHKTSNRTGYRHGYEQTTVVMGGNKTNQTA